MLGQLAQSGPTLWISRAGARGLRLQRDRPRPARAGRPARAAACGGRGRLTPAVLDGGAVLYYSLVYIMCAAFEKWEAGWWHLGLLGCYA